MNSFIIVGYIISWDFFASFLSPNVHIHKIQTRILSNDHDIKPTKSAVKNNTHCLSMHEISDQRK